MKMLVKRNSEKAYLIEDFMATNISKKDFYELKRLNERLLSGFDFVDNKDIDYSWWYRVEKKLTLNKIVSTGFTWHNGKVVEL